MPSISRKAKLAFTFSVVAICMATTSTRASAQQPQAPAQNQQMDTLAVVNGQPITRQQVATQTVRRFGADVLRGIIKKQLVYNECVRLGINISEKDINDEITKRASQFKMSAEHWVNLICQRRSLTTDQLKNDLIWHDVALRRLAADQIQVSPQDLQKQIAIKYGDKVQVREIVCSDIAMAQQILPMVKGPNAQDFGAVAKNHSINPNSAAVRGLLPPVPRHVSSNAQMEQLIFSLQEGEVSDPITVADDQVIILKCERIFPAMQLTDEQLAAEHDRLVDEISQTKLAAAAQSLSNELQASAKIVNVHNDPQLSAQMPGVAATVNGTQITKRYLAEQCIEQFGQAVLSSEINRTILMQALEANGKEVTPQEIEREIMEAASMFGQRKPDGSVNKEAWLDFVTRGDRDKVDFYLEDEVWPSTALKILVRDGVQVTQQDMQKGFEANFGPRVEALAMVFNDQRQATKVWQMAMANPTAEYFGKLANQYSVEPASQANFGEVPPIQRHGGRSRLEDAAFQLKPGEISEVVQVGEHFVVIMAQGQTTPRITQIDDVKDQLHRDIYEKKIRIAMAEQLDELTTRSQIDNFMAGTSQAGQSTQTANRNGQAPRVPFKTQR
jgi:parvulin-like peptidyl-prolyl isomerase